MLNVNRAISIEPCPGKELKFEKLQRGLEMLRNVISKMLSLLDHPVRSQELNEWARLEFGRDLESSDLEGRVS